MRLVSDPATLAQKMVEAIAGTITPSAPLLTPADYHVHVDGRPIYPLVPLTATEAAHLFAHVAERDPGTVEIRRIGRHRFDFDGTPWD